MPGLRDTKVTDFFQRQPSLRISNDPSPTSSQSPEIVLLRTAPKGNPTQHRSRVLYNSPKENSSSRASVPSKRKLDDDDETASITSSSVPLSLYCIPRQTLSLSPSKPPESPLTTDNFSPPQTKRRRGLASPVPHSLQAPVTPKMARGKEIIPTSQSSEAGLYTPIRSPNLISQRRSDVQESVENWRHGRSAYRCTIVSPPRFSPGVDYSMEVDRPLSPLTSYPTTSLGSPPSSFTDADAIPSDVDLERPPSPLAKHSLPTPSSSEDQGHGSPVQIVKSPPVRPVTPPPSSPEQEPVPVVPKDSKARTAEIIAEIWANVRAKSAPDSEDSYLHVPINDDLSSEEEDEPFWKRTKTPACRSTPAPTTGGARSYLHSSLPSPCSPSPSPPPVSDDSLPLCNDHNGDDDDDRHVSSFSISEPISPLKGKRPTQGYDHDTLLSNFSIEVDEPVDTTRSRLADENTTRRLPGLQTDDAGPDIAANTLEDEVLQDDRERLLGAKEGEAVGKILDADRKMGQTATHCVSGVSVFVSDYERTVNAELCTEALPTCGWARDKQKTATLQMLDEAIEHQDIEYMQAVFGILNADDIAIPGVAQWLCEQALWCGHEHVGRFSRKFLLELPLWAQSYPGSPLSVDILVQTMMRLGLRKDLSMHLQPLRDATITPLQNRPMALRSMVKLISSFAPRWSMEQLPDAVMVLLLIGVDMNTTTELRRDIVHSISLLCHQLPADPEASVEISLANKVLDLMTTISASDQALVLSCFSQGSPGSLRIARAVAHHVLIGSRFPPPLVSVLSSPDEGFSITDSTDYDALTSRIAVLSVALSGIESYVAEESMLRKLAQAPEGSPRKREPVPLEQIRTRLDAIHGKIFDTRAAHLDRSRAKGAIQRLSMRIHYQRAALSKTGGQLRLGDFFSPGCIFRQPKRRNLNWS
ncbi:hypothetical protein BGY98DRAFT_1093767 [Russula aff. rugulosa BPL654]|nr:hypothetical protein BGY98DRAFT_1093767 [Russula aff. rugulosa BPL654]